MRQKKKYLFLTSLDGYWENSVFALNSASQKLLFPLSKSCTSP